jgi:hypothetical protein
LSEVHRHGRAKPYGYSGDFQMIDWTYIKYLGKSDGRGRLWDAFYHRQVAPQAVCDRKERFGVALAEVAKDRSLPISVLNIGSGPAREVLDGAAFAKLPPSRLTVVCVDADERALAYARRVLGSAWKNDCTFENKSALRYRPKGTYDLVWSSGLFDYLEERLAVHLLKLMWTAVAPGGRVMVGNFADTHSTRPWIEWCGDWFLIHRTREDMQRLAEQAGLGPPQAKLFHEIDRWNGTRSHGIEIALKRIPLHIRSRRGD